MNLESSSIGVIGGADGPTAIVVTGTVNWAGLIMLAAAVAAAVFLLLRRRKKK